MYMVTVTHPELVKKSKVRLIYDSLKPVFLRIQHQYTVIVDEPVIILQ